MQCMFDRPRARDRAASWPDAPSARSEGGGLLGSRSRERWGLGAGRAALAGRGALRTTIAKPLPRASVRYHAVAPVAPSPRSLPRI